MLGRETAVPCLVFKPNESVVRLVTPFVIECEVTEPVVVTDVIPKLLCDGELWNCDLEVFGVLDCVSGV
ncbi:unnamed protein product [Schistosoma mattheei]|uniref:Uncharacterized protein n=1 Tax=Schistosoma mattheei TaxID=31246 RepID=A0A3P8J7S0_9TREM|nr:unnamed protein product [Schistosoma mattheei]